jgi:hypothetical protein
MMRAGALASAFLVCLLPSSAAATAPDVVVGVNYNDFGDPVTELLPAHEVAGIEQQLGVRIHRYAVRWTAIQPEGPDQWLWTKFDEMYNADRARGIRPLFVVSHAPYWAWPPDQACGPNPSPSAAAQCNVPPDATGVVTHLEDFKTFITALVSRYPAAAGIEVWNEPNHDGQWKTAAAKSTNGGGSPSEYTPVLQAVYTAVQAVEPTIERNIGVITGGMHMAMETDGARTRPSEWISDLFQEGAAGYLDGVGYHLYPKQIPLRTTAFAFQEMKTVEDLVAENDPGHGIWVTETGYSTTNKCTVSGVVHDPCTKADQAVGTPPIFHALADDPQVEVALSFTLFDLTSEEGSVDQLGFGLIDRDLTPKPAYCSLALDWTDSDPCVSDPDHDGLPDFRELELGTDPNKADTDDDGTLDGSDSAPLDPTRAGSQGAAPVFTQAPPEYTQQRDITFEFTTKLSGAILRCSLDGAPFADCTSPVTYLGMTKKLHTFSVKAIDADGIAGLVATRKFTIDQTVPNTKIQSGPFGVTADPRATFRFTSTEPGTFECSIDSAPYVPCTSPRTYTILTPGPHTFAVRAVDRAGNVDASPATWTWTLVGSAPPPSG